MTQEANERYICNIHGDIGSEGNASLITFNFPPNTEERYCAKCWRDWWRKHYQPVTLVPGVK